MESDSDGAPNAATSGPQVPADYPSDAERSRGQYFRYEASVTSIAILFFYVGAIEGVLLSATAAAAALAATDRRARDWFLLFGLGSALFAMISYAIGCGLQRLQRWAQSTIAAASLIAIATLVVVFAASPENVTALVIGLAGCGYFLYTVSGAGGRMVFSDEYRETIAKTPQIRYRVSIVVSLPLAILIASYACAAAAVVLSVAFGR